MRPALDPAEAGPGQPITTVEASDLQVVVADAHLLFTTAFSQIGDDVPLTGENGAILFIKDYFVLDAPPTLLSPAGAMMPPDLVSKRVGPMALGQYPPGGYSGRGGAYGQGRDADRHRPGNARRWREGSTVTSLGE